jgi:hypothetical protein
MSYSLIQLAPGAYDLYLADIIAASVVRSGLRQPYTWTAELLEDLPRSKRPSPFRTSSTASRRWKSCAPGSVIRR